MVYLDYAANTPIEKEVLDTYYQATMKYFANPNANHTLGSQAKEVIDQTTKHIAEQLHVLPEEVLFLGVNIMIWLLSIVHVVLLKDVL